MQANLDYVSEEDAILKMRVGVGLGPLVTALYAASPLVDGEPTDYKSFRAHCWLDTDNDRCGVLPFCSATDKASAITPSGRSMCRCFLSIGTAPIRRRVA